MAAGHSTLEAVPPVIDESPKYLDQAPPQHSTLAPMNYNPDQSYAVTQPTYSYSRTNRWTRWPCLLLFALLVAVVSGLAGGFIGKAITDNKHDGNNNSPQAGAASATPICAPSSPNNSTIKPQIDDNNKNTTDIAFPDTQCPDNEVLSLQSEFTQVEFRRYCNVDWRGDDMIGFLAATMSDCMEACATWNQNIQVISMVEKGDGKSKECVGAAFAVQWVNRTRAVEDIGQAANCLLKNNIKNKPNENARLKDGIDVVGLCLAGKCPQD